MNEKQIKIAKICEEWTLDFQRNDMLTEAGYWRSVNGLSPIADRVK